MKKKPPIYILDRKMKWSVFKKLQDRLVRLEGIVFQGMDKILWIMLRERKILCWFDPLAEGDMQVGLEFPKGRKMIMLTNPRKKNPNPKSV